MKIIAYVHYSLNHTDTCNKCSLQNYNTKVYSNSGNQNRENDHIKMVLFEDQGNELQLWEELKLKFIGVSPQREK